MSDRFTEYGFTFGVAEVTRIIEHRGHRWLRIDTPRQAVVVHITPTGLLRISRENPLPTSAPKGGENP